MGSDSTSDGSRTDAKADDAKSGCASGSLDDMVGSAGSYVEASAEESAADSLGSLKEEQNGRSKDSGEDPSDVVEVESRASLHRASEKRRRERQSCVELP